MTLDVNHDVAPIQIFLILLDIIDYNKPNYLAHNLEEYCPSVLKSSNRLSSSKLLSIPRSK